MIEVSGFKFRYKDNEYPIPEHIIAAVSRKRRTYRNAKDFQKGSSAEQIIQMDLNGTSQCKRTNTWMKENNLDYHGALMAAEAAMSLSVLMDE